MRLVQMMASVGVFVLAGCAQQQQQQRIAEADAALNQRIAECEAQYPRGEGKNALQRFRCVEPAQRAAFVAGRAPGDLVDVLLATTADVAAKVDRGEMTREEGTLRIAQTKRELADTEQSRRNAALTATAPFMPRAPVQFAPQQTSCTQFGNTVNCNSY